MADDISFLRKKREREERGKDHRCPGEDGIDARPHVKQCHDLRYLMNDVRQTGNQAKTDGANVDLGAAAKLKQDERDDSETGHGVAVEILRPRIVETVEVE